MPAIVSASRSFRPYFSPSALHHSLQSLELRIYAHHSCTRIASKCNLTGILVVTSNHFFNKNSACFIEFNFTLHSSKGRVLCEMLDLYYNSPRSSSCKCVQILHLSTPQSDLGLVATSYKKQVDDQ